MLEVAGKWVYSKMVLYSTARRMRTSQHVHQKILHGSMWLWVACCAAVLAMAVSRAVGAPVSKARLAEFTAISADARLQWMRCTVGQRWSGESCIGVARALSLAEARAAATVATRELGGSWRLPRLEELQQLVCRDCGKPTIDLRIYPNTIAAPYWCDEGEDLSAVRHWSVNFANGLRYGRNAPEMRRYVRLVRDLE